MVPKNNIIAPVTLTICAWFWNAFRSNYLHMNYDKSNVNKWFAPISKNFLLPDFNMYNMYIEFQAACAVTYIFILLGQKQITFTDHNWSQDLSFIIYKSNIKKWFAPISEIFFLLASIRTLNFRRLVQLHIFLYFLVKSKLLRLTIIDPRILVSKVDLVGKIL